MTAKYVSFAGERYLIIIGQSGVIISDKECIHVVYTLDEVESGESFHYSKETLRKEGNVEYLGWITKECNVNRVVNKPGERVTDESIRAWVHYFGVKARIESNYFGLSESIQEIKSDLTLPDWNS